jgi:NOL1/NOP2/fmu family ribosome biogenesis protein
MHGSFLLRQHQDLIIGIPEKHHLLIEFLSSVLKVIHRGTAIGIVKHEKIIPDHGLALSIHLKKESFLQMSVSLEQARIYLKKDTFYQEHAAKGHALVIYEDNPIGWVNLLGNRINNLYPTEWRIRMSL